MNGVSEFYFVCGVFVSFAGYDDAVLHDSHFGNAGAHDGRGRAVCGRLFKLVNRSSDVFVVAKPDGDKRPNANRLSSIESGSPAQIINVSENAADLLNSKPVFQSRSCRARQ